MRRSAWRCWTAGRGPPASWPATPGWRPRQGRHRYLQLAGAHVAELIEDLSSLAPAVPPAPVGPALTGSRRPLVRSCVDWSERRPHLAGTAGAALCRHLFDQRWITRIGTTRAVAVTPSGQHALRDLLGLDIADRC